MTPRPNRNVYECHQDPFQILLSQKQEEELQSESSRGESLLPSDDPFLYSASSDDRVDLEFALSFNNSQSRSNLLSRSNHQTHPQSSSLLQAPRISRHHSSSSSSSNSSSSNTSTSTAISDKTVKQLQNSLLNPLAQARLSTNPTPISPAPAITLNSTSAISSDHNLSTPTSISTTTSSKKSFSLDHLERFKDDPLVEEDTDRRPVSLYSPITVTNSQSSSSTTRSNPNKTSSLLPSIDHETRSIDFNQVRSLKDSKRGILFSGEKIKSKSSWSEIQKDKGKEKEKGQVGIEDRDKKIGKQVQSLQPSAFGSSSNSASTSLPDSNRIRKKKDLSLINPQDRDNLFISTSLAKAFEKSRSLIENENQKLDLKFQPSEQSPIVEASKSLPTISTSDSNLKDQSEPNPSEESEESIEMDPGLAIVGMKTDPNLDSNSNGNETKQTSGSIRRPSFAFWERARKLSSTNDTSNRGRSNSSVSNKNKDGNGSKVMTRDTSESSSSPEFIVRSVDGRRKSMERFEKNKTNPSGTIGSGSGIENSKIRIGLGLDSELQEREKEIGFSSSSNEDEILSSNSSLHTNPLIRTASSSSSSNSSLGPSDSRNGHKNRNRGEALPSNMNPIGLESEINDGNDDTSKKDLRSRSASTSTFRIDNSNTPSSLLSQDGRESIMSNNDTSSNSTLKPSSNLNNSKHIHLHRSALAIERYNQDDEILTLLNDGKEYSSDSDDDLHFSLDSNLAFAKQNVGSSQSHSHHTRSQSEDRGSTPTKDNSIKDLARVKRRRKLLKNQINIARKAKDSIQSEQDSKSSNGVSGRRRSASSVATTSSSLGSSANSSRSNRRSSVTGNMSLRETEEEDGGIKGGDEAEIGERRRRDRSNTVAGAVTASSIPKGDDAAASPSKTSKSLQEEFENSSQTKSNSSLTVESFGRSDGTYTPSLISSAEDDSFYDANERGSGTSSSASNRSETEDQPVAVVDDQQQSLHKDEQSLISANHGLRSSRRKFNTSTSNAITPPPIGLGIEQNPGTQSNIDDIEDEDEEDEDGNPTLNRKKTISPMVYVANSSATLRQDAIARDPPSSSIHSVPSSRSSSYDTQESYGSIKKSSTLNPISTSYSSMSSPSPSFSLISSTASQNYSPISSASSSSFSPNIPVVSTPSSSKMFIRSPSLRGSRIVPPLKPSPTSPLPPPPPNFNSIAGSTPSRPLSGISLLSSDNQVTKERTQKNQEMDAVVLKLKNLGKELGGKGIGRSRSQSLGQASENLVSDESNRLSSLRNPSEIYRNKGGSSSTFISPPALSRTTSTDSSSRRNRSSSHIPPSLNLHGSMTNPIPSPLSTSRPRPLASTTEETEPSKSTSSDEKSATSSSSTPTSASSLDRGATIRGRPRGATVGAVPYSGSNHHPSSRISIQTRSRPRSLLSNEILIPDSVRAEWDREEKEKLPQRSNPTSSENSISPPNRVNSSNSIASTSSTSRSFGDDYLSSGNADTSASTSASATGGSNSTNSTSSPAGSTLASNSTGAGAGNGTSNTTTNGNTGSGGGGSSERSRSGSNSNGSGNAGGNASGGGRDREGGGGGRSRSGSNASLLQQVQHPPKSHASFVIAVVGHRGTGKSTVIKKGLRQFGLSKPNVLSEKVTSHSTVCVVDQEQRTIEVLEIDASVLLNAPGKRFAWPKFLPRIDAVILCYDAGQISSFRGMSELLDNFAQGHLSTVMLACKSEIFPKQVDPYYASDMAAVYNVGLAECTVQSEEGKKRMRDCFSYLVKEVAKARAGRQRKANASPHQPSSREREKDKDKERTKDASPDRRNRAGSGSSAAANSNASASGNPTGDLDGGSSVSVHSASSSHGSHSSTRDRNNSGASSTVESVPSAASYSSSGVPYSEEHTATIAQQQQHFQNQSRSNEALSESERYRNIRKMSDATTASDAPSFPESNSEEDHAVQQSISKAQLGLQSAQSVGGYVSIDELWDKFFFAAVSGNDERFLLMFMVFYRGFAKPIDLLRQLIERFDKLAMSERSDGVMIRFSLMRLTNMLGEWVQDYPGDLSGPETYPVVCSFYQKLLQHPSTVHVASPLQPHIEACRYAPDVDAVWSKAEDSDKPQSVAADVAPISTMINPELSGSATSLPKPPSTKSVNSSSSVPSVNSPPPPLPGQEEGSEGNTRSRGQSDASSFGPPVDNAHLSPKPIETRHRSASDVTSSSSDGIRGPQSNAGSVVTASSASIAPSTVSSNPTMDRSPSEQKTFLRGVSNALGELDDEAIAGELTRLEWNLFTTIRPRDLLRHILVARDLREKNGPVARSIAHFNYVSFWVCSMILVQGKTKHRAKMLEKFMNVAAILRRDNNYNTLHSVLAGLGNASIHRLKHTRELLNGKPVIKTYQSLARLMGSDRSFAAYRLALENSENRTIPYLGVHLQDILSMSDGNPSKRASDGMVHWRKFSLMDEAVMAIVKCQQHDRPTRPNPAVERLIMDLPVMDEETLYQRSLEVEPRSSQPSKIKKLMMQGTAS